MIDIVPAVLPDSFEDLQQSLERIRGASRLVQIDVCDGAFVKARTWPMQPSDREHFAEIIKGEEGLPFWQDFDFEVDLMTHTPERLLPWWIAAGIVRAVIHLESRHDLVQCREAAGDSIELGLAINLTTSPQSIAAHIQSIDYIQVMGIGTIGRQGEPTDERVYHLIEKVKAAFPDVTLQVDGGVNEVSAGRLIDAGADRLVVGSAIMSSDNPKAAIKMFETL